jgi:prepilin-type N-terminal cleavage/methylation domain-containing protein
MRLKNKNGFTLVELLISISIIAILSVVLTISFSNAQKSSRDQRRIADLKAVQNAAEQVFLLSGSYPVNSWYDFNDKWTINGQVVLESFPRDPKSVSYTKNSSGATSYCICTTMEKGEGNAENLTDCNFQNKLGFYCVKNQQ